MRPHIIAAVALFLFGLATIATASNCFSGVCGVRGGHVKAVHVNKFVGHGHNFGYYPNHAPGYGYGDQTFKPLEQRIGEATAKALADELERRGIGAGGAAQQKLGGVAQHCVKCHGEGKSAQGAFDMTLPWTYERANHAQTAFMGLDSLPNMAAKAGVQEDGEAIQAILKDLTMLPRDAATKQ